MVNRHKGLLLEIPEGTIQNNRNRVRSRGKLHHTNLQGQSSTDFCWVKEFLWTGGNGRAWSFDFNTSLQTDWPDDDLSWFDVNICSFANTNVNVQENEFSKYEETSSHRNYTGKQNCTKKKIDCHCYMETKNMCNTSWRKRISCIKTCIL